MALLPAMLVIYSSYRLISFFRPFPHISFFLLSFTNFYSLKVNIHLQLIYPLMGVTIKKLVVFFLECQLTVLYELIVNADFVKPANICIHYYIKDLTFWITQSA